MELLDENLSYQSPLVGHDLNMLNRTSFKQLNFFFIISHMYVHNILLIFITLHISLP
jgi:hypothetical protein